MIGWKEGHAPCVRHACGNRDMEGSLDGLFDLRRASACLLYFSISCEI